MRYIHFVLRALALFLALAAYVVTCLSFASVARADAAATLRKRPPKEARAARVRHERVARPLAHPHRLIVKFREGLTPDGPGRALSRAGVRMRKRLRTRGLRAVEVVDRSRRIEEVIDRLTRDPAVEYAEPDYLVHATSLFPNDPGFGQLWGLHNTGQSFGTPDVDIDAPEAWDASTGASAIVVGVIDSGVDYTHEDLADNMWRNPGEVENGLDDDGNGYVDDVFGINCIDGTGDPFDDFYHGTHVAGTIGAVGDNGIGIVGVSWDVQIMALKFLASDGWGTLSDAIECLEYATLMEANGVNLRLTSNSWGGGGFSQALEDAIRATGQADMLFVAAAGNDYGRDTDADPVYPSSYDLENVVSVAATDRNDALASFSNFGVRSVDLAAPGVSILSTTPGSTYGYANGTSMATPHVSGAAALLWGRHPSASAAAIKALLLASVDPAASVAGRVLTSGRLNAANATCAPGDHRLALLPGSGFRPATGQPNRVEAMLMDCAAPILGGSVEVSFSNGDAPVALHDDGVPPDAVANDGRYAGSWSPEGLGAVTLTAEASFAGGPLESSVTWHLPDYSVSDDVPFDWVDTTGGQSSGIAGDDTSVQIPLGFDFEFFGSIRNTVTISSNGYLTFGPYGQEYLNYPVPNPANPSDVIAPYWDDLNPSLGGEVVYLVAGSAPNRSLTVEWRDVPYYGDATPATFQVTLYEADGRILFRYLDVESAGPWSARGASATVGVEDETGARGVQYSYNTPALSDGTAIELSPASGNPCLDTDGDEICDAEDNCPFTPNPGQEDSGGLGSGDPDGIGDACQCGDVTDDGKLTVGDFQWIKSWVGSLETVSPGPGFDASKCDVSGDRKCKVGDFQSVKTAVGSMSPAGLQQSCLPAVP
jgi:subtilisin family serine protease